LEKSGILATMPFIAALTGVLDALSYVLLASRVRALPGRHPSSSGGRTIALARGFP
jgi:hypothetical protein